MKKILVLLLVIILTGCASSIMKSYVGKDLTQPVLEYGPPSFALDIDKDTRAFTWIMDSTYVTPTTTTGSVTGNNGFYSYNSITTPSSVGTSRCNYTIYAQKKENPEIEGPAAWKVTGFKKPKFMCE